MYLIEYFSEKNNKLCILVYICRSFNNCFNNKFPTSIEQGLGVTHLNWLYLLRDKSLKSFNEVKVMHKQC